MFPTQNQGETQDDDIEFTTNGYEIDSDDTPIESIHNIGKHQRAYNTIIGIRGYFILMKDDDSHNAILGWQIFCLVHNIMMIVEPQPDNKQSPSLNPKKRSTSLEKKK